MRYLLAFLLPLCAWSQAADVKALWDSASGHEFYTALKSGAGFSFTMAGNRIGPSMPADWQVSSRGNEVTFRHSSGLTVIRQARLFPEFQAIEYTLRFKNDSQTASPALTNINTMDLTFGGDLIKGVTAVSSGGGAADNVYPPRDFAITRTYFGPMTPLNGQLTLTADQGNPSRVNLPMFFVENQAKAAGIFAGIGWTGQWKASVAADYRTDELRLSGGMSDVNLKLNPGEEISGPIILVGAYRGPLSSGSNRLRRLIRERYAPTVAGKQLVPPMLYTTWFDVGLELDDKLFRVLTGQAAGLHQEILMMDAGWYKGVPTGLYTDMGNTWVKLSNPLGNWELGEELSRFPSGLPALADYVRSKGMGFGLWFEPERAGPPSLIARQHPEWMIKIPNRPWLMVNFGAPGVVEYFCKILDRYINEDGAKYIRWDQNNNLYPYWLAADPPDRRGSTEIRHVEGIHKVEDYVREHHPEVIFESCAGGGQRIDLQTLQRRHTIWVSDQTMDPHLVRFHLEGLNLFIPGNAQMVGFAPPTSTYQKPGFSFPDIAYQSFFGGAFGVAGRLHEWPDALRVQARKHFEAYRKIRQFVAEDYYALLPQSRNLENWAGWQFHNPKSGEGFVQAFRIHSPEPVKKLQLQALDAKATYRFTDIYTGKSFDVTGAKLASEGLEFELPQMSSRVLLYKGAL